MNGFDPSSFVKAERQAPLSPPVAASSPSVAADGDAGDMADFSASGDGWGQSVATVATVARDMDPLALDRPFAEEINRLLTFANPPCFRPSQWFRLRYAICELANSGKLAEILAAGWEPIEIFGFPAKPWAAPRLPIYQLGLVMLLRGRRCGMVAADRVEIIARSGPSQFAYKEHFMSGRAGSAMIWDVLHPGRWPMDALP